MTLHFDELKKHGFLKQKNKDHLAVRFRSISGNLTSDELRQLADLADRYGRGYVHVTTRQGTEIPWVSTDQALDMHREIQALGLNTGASGATVRTVVACPGSEVCRYGVVNSRETAAELDRLFFGRVVPKKTKIAVTGCPNSCAKPQENDIGLMGVVRQGEKGYAVFAGGRVGRKPCLGRKVADFIPADRASGAVEHILLVFGQLAEPGERIADTIARVGEEAFAKGIGGTGQVNDAAASEAAAAFDIAATLDITPDYCPITFVKTKIKLEELKHGDILEVFLSDGAPAQNVPRSVKADGHKILLLEKAGDGYRLLIEKVGQEQI